MFQGAPCGHVCDGAQTAPPLTLIIHGKDLGTYRTDGAKRVRAGLIKRFRIQEFADDRFGLW